MWLLDSGGGFANLSVLPGRVVDAETFGEERPQDEALTLRFGAYADGRGFSVARQLRARGFAGRLYAVGPLVPDQARHAVQSGFDGIVVSDESAARHGEAAWRDALVSMSELYVKGAATRGAERGLWHLRNAAHRTLGQSQ